MRINHVIIGNSYSESKIDYVGVAIDMTYEQLQILVHRGPMRDEQGDQFLP